MTLDVCVVICVKMPDDTDVDERNEDIKRAFVAEIKAREHDLSFDIDYVEAIEQEADVDSLP